MRSLLLSVLLLTFLPSFSQTIRINLLGGIANYKGEIQPRNYTFDQAKSAFGVGASLDITDHFLIRTEYSFAKLGADDKLGKIPSYRARNLNFKTYIQEINLMGEYNILNIYDKKLVPYVFAGVGVFKFSPYTRDSLYGKQYLVALNTEGQGLPEFPDRKQYKTIQMNIPVGGGVKYALSDDVQIGVEYGIRFLFTDYLDDVSRTYVDENRLLETRGPIAVALAFRGDELKTNPQAYPPGGSLRGSNNANDFYYYVLARLSIRMPWFENKSSRGKNRLGCPVQVL